MAITEFPRMVGMSVLSSLVSGLVPLLFFRNGVKKNTLLLLLGLSAGILFAIATVDLIPEGIGVSSSYRRASLHPPKGHEHDHDNETAEFGRLVTMVGVGIGFFSLVLLEQIMVAFGATHSHQSEVAVGEDLEQGKHAHRNQSGLSDSFSLTAFAAIAMHSLVDGIVIGGSFRVSSVIGVRVAIAIVLHKVRRGFCHCLRFKSLIRFRMDLLLRPC
jgi:zinc transporter ZupT